MLPAQANIEPMPCPRCGKRFIAGGKHISVRTPRIVRGILARRGLTCVNCGFYATSIGRWNQEAIKYRNSRSAEPQNKEPHSNGTYIYAFGETGEVTKTYEVPNVTMGALAVWLYMEDTYLPVYRPETAKESAWYREDMSDEEFVTAYKRRPHRSDNLRPQAMQEVFGLLTAERVPASERLVLETTIGDRLLRTQDILTAIAAFRSFPGDTNLPQQANILEEILRIDGVVAVGWKQGPCYGIDWSHVTGQHPGWYDANRPPYNCLTGTIHHWIGEGRAT